MDATLTDHERELGLLSRHIGEMATAINKLNVNVARFTVVLVLLVLFSNIATALAIHALSG